MVIIQAMVTELSVEIYNLTHIMGLSQLITIKYSINVSSNSSILLYNKNIISPKIITRITKNKIFDETIEYEDSLFYSIVDDDKLVDSLCSYFDNLLAKYDDISMIYSAADLANSFGIYSSLKNYPITVFENYQNQFTLIDRYNWGHKDGWLSDSYYFIQKKSEILCNEHGFYNSFIYPNTNLNECSNRKKIDFDHLFELLDKPLKNRLLKCFDIDITSFSGDLQLLLLNSESHCLNTTIYKRDQIPHIYHVLLDYYGESKKILLKQHPHDHISYSKYFDECIEMRPDVPIEFIKLVEGLTISSIISGYTTAGFRLQNYTKRYVQAGLKFFRYVHILHEIVLALDLCKYLGVKEVYMPLDKEFVESLLKSLKFDIPITYKYKDNTKTAHVMISGEHHFKTTNKSPQIWVEQSKIIIPESICKKTYQIISEIKWNSNDFNINNPCPLLLINCPQSVTSYEYERKLLFEKAIIKTKSIENVSNRIVTFDDFKQLLETTFITKDKKLIEAISKAYQDGTIVYPSPEEIDWWNKIRL